MEQLQLQRIEGLVVIGGSGSQKGALELSKLGLRVCGVASTIDNDLVGSEVTIGVDTALNIALEAIDRLRATGSSMGRAFLVEVMGRRCGYLALMAGIAGGAEAIVIPEFPCDPVSVALEVRAAHERGKSHAIIVIAEGAEYNAEAIAKYFDDHQANIGFVSHVTILGHMQRGGIPTAFDRILATRLGAAAVEHLVGGDDGRLVGLLKGEIVSTPLERVATEKKPLDLKILELANVLAK